MKECINCKAKNRDTDLYCRNCGNYMQSTTYYVIINIMICFISIAILGLIVLFITSYMV